MPSLALVETIGEGSGCGFVHQTQNFESGDAAGVAGGLALGVVEVSGNGDDSLDDGAAERGFRVAL